MDSPTDESPSSVCPAELDARERLQVFKVFSAWCLRREAFSKWSYLILIAPFFTAGIVGRIRLGFSWNSGQSRELFRVLTGISALFIVIGGVRYASKAVCWEVSRDLRDLVRLTGIDPRTLLWCQLLSRWWTIGLSIVLMAPFAIFVGTLGGGTSDQWIAGICWLVLLAALFAGFAAIASVSTGQSSNAETTAAWATFLLMLFYHMLFWGFAVFAFIVLQNEPFGQSVAEFAGSFAPATGLYRATVSSTTFSPLDPTYWLHFVTAFLCLRMASTVMRNRFRITTQGDRDLSELVPAPEMVVTPNLGRPRCGDRPFVWKDTYILGDGESSRNWWAILSCFALVGVIASALYGIPLVIGILAICLAPCFIAVRFDGLLAAEFREQTWTSLILLPVDPHLLVLAKVQAAAWERRAILLPVGIAALIASFSNVTLVLMSLTIALCAGVLMIEISVLSQFNAKIWWAGPLVGVLVIGLIMINVIIWIGVERWIAFPISIGTLSIAAYAFFENIDRRLKNWSDG